MQIHISPYVIPGVRKVEEVRKKLYTEPQLIEAIKVETIKYFNLERDQVFSRCRKRELVLARKIMHYLAKRMTTLSLKRIGEEFPQRTALDHTSIIVSIRSLTNWMETDEYLKSQVIDIRMNIEGHGIELVSNTPKSKSKEVIKRPIPKPPMAYRKKDPKKPEEPKKIIRAQVPIPKVIIESKPPAPIIRMETLSEHEKTMAKYL